MFVKFYVYSNHTLDYVKVGDLCGHIGLGPSLCLVPVVDLRGRGRSTVKEIPTGDRTEHCRI